MNNDDSDTQGALASLALLVPVALIGACLVWLVALIFF
jgi:hypothetical protein